MTVFDNRKTLKQLARETTVDAEICRTHPGGMGGDILGRYARVTSPAMKGALWGDMGHLTLSLQIGRAHV